MTIVEFLTARLDDAIVRAEEFEQDYASAKNGDYGSSSGRDWWPAVWYGAERLACTPDQIRADVAAKRRIIEEYGDKVTGNGRITLVGGPTPGGPHFDVPVTYVTSRGHDRLLRLLAQPYASHPEYDSAWSVA